MSADGGQAGEALQFDKAEFAAAQTCGGCKRVVTDEYFAAGGQVVCSSCARQLKGGGGRVLLRASLYGAAAAILGTVVWFAILKIFDTELGLIAIGVGVLVGLAVRKGSGGRGGWKYQAIAMALTYVSITASYVPFVLKGIASGLEKKEKTATGSTNTDETEKAQSPTSAAGTVDSASQKKPNAFDFLILAGVVFGLAFASPFLGGASNIMGIIIIGIALYEAWKLNKAIPLTGPFRVATAPPPLVASPVPGPNVTSG